MPKYILGISAFHHDSAAALLKDGEIVAAVQEERFTRKKHDPCFPKYAIDYCLKEAGIGKSSIDLIAFDDIYKRDVKKNCNFVVSRYSTNITSLTPQVLFIHHHLIRQPYL